MFREPPSLWCFGHSSPSGLRQVLLRFFLLDSSASPKKLFELSSWGWRPGARHQVRQSKGASLPSVCSRSLGPQVEYTVPLRRAGALSGRLCDSPSSEMNLQVVCGVCRVEGERMWAVDLLALSQGRQRGGRVRLLLNPSPHSQFAS